jgi:hypothetical protein
VRIATAALICVALVVVGAVLVSGGSDTDPRTPAALPGLPPPFLGTTVTGDGGMTAAVDAYGDVVDLRAPGPAGRALVENPAARQVAGTVAAGIGIVPRVRIGGEEVPLWRADRVWQRYRPGTNVVVTGARFGSAEVRIAWAVAGRRLGCLTDAGRISRSVPGERSLPPEPRRGGAEPRAELPRGDGPAAEISMAVEEPTAGSRLRCDDGAFDEPKARTGAGWRARDRSAPPRRRGRVGCTAARC